MKAVVQHVTRARATPGGAIGAGLLVLLGVADGDTESEADRLAGKIARLRIFEGETGKFDRSLLDTGCDALVVSQFTLMSPSRCMTISCDALRKLGVDVQTGVFGARMQVELVNDGPVTLVVER